MKLKVLFFISGVASGGIAKGLIPFVNSFNNDPDINIEADLLIGSGANQTIDESLLSDKTMYLNKNSGFKNMTLLNKIKAFLRLVAVFREGNYDVVVSCGAYARWLGPIMASLFKVRSIVNEPVAFSPKNHYSGKVISWMFIFFSKIRFSLSEIIAVNSDPIGAEICEQCGVEEDKIKTLFNWYDLENIRMLANNPSQSLPLSITPRCDFRFVTVSRLVERKGILGLIHSIKRVRDSGFDCGLMIVGDGPIRNILEAEITKLELDEHIVLTGHVNNPYWFMKNSDAFVLNSDFEGTPTVIVEAMALDMPIIATDCPSGVKEMLDTEFGLAGRLIPLQNPKALDDSLTEFMSSPELLLNFSEVSEKALEKYDNKNVRKNWIEALSKSILK